MSYYWCNRKKLLKNAWEKQRAPEYYRKNSSLIRLEARNKYKNLSERKRIKKENIKEKDTPCILT